MTAVDRVLLAISCIGLLVFCGCGNVAAPTSFVEHNAKDGSYCLQVPEGWDQSDGGRNQYHHSTIKKGGAKIDITASGTSSMIMGGDIAVSDSFDDSDDPDALDLTAIAAAHQHGLEKMLLDFDDLVATKAEKLHTDLGDARRSEITYSGSLGGTVRGYFASIDGHNQLVTVICTCGEDNWESLKPAFAKAIETMAPGRDERYGG